ncbi:MAG: hypothetical protein IT368_13030 [Candidatus Hydrogenedentes bacterium]|nr:hypothetical protein [Candidatus Hydrogenedentota bacterium]
MQYLRSIGLVTLLLSGLLLCGCPDNSFSPVGANLDSVTDWSTDWPFVDAFKSSRPWISGSAEAWDDGRPLDLDEHGWVRSLLPGQEARTLLFRQAPIYPAGQYHVFYEGEGGIAYQFAAVKNEALSVPGHDVIDVDPNRDEGIYIVIYQTNPANYLRNIRVIMPGGVLVNDPFTFVPDPAALPAGQAVPLWQVYEKQVFHPLYLQRVRRYKTLRFMDWMRTNWSPSQHWEDRITPQHAQWSTDYGVPVEVMCDLANRIGADPWFTMPHLATDDYVANFAATVRARLRPGLKVYIEYSNEVWNGGFGQAQYCKAQGYALHLGGNEFETQMRYYSQRAVEIFQIFEDVFGGTDRLVRVLGSQASNTGVSPIVLAWQDAYLHTDALAIAPYFGYELGLQGNYDRVAAMNLDDLFVELETVSLPDTFHWMEAQAAVAAQYGVQLVAYEGGQHLVGVNDLREDPTLNALFDAANRDPRMGDLYAQYLEGWRQHTDGVFALFSHCGVYSKWGRWGMLEYMTQPVEEAPKFQAVNLFIDSVQTEMIEALR